MTLRIRATVGTVLLLAGTLSCGSDSGPTAPEPPTVASVSLIAPSATLLVGQSMSLTARALDAAGAGLTSAIAFVSSDPAVASVSAGGVVSALSAGATTISASADGKSASIALTIEAPGPGRIVIAPASGWLAQGVDYALSITAYDAIGRVVADPSVTLTSSDPSITTVSPSGLVHPIALGTVTISAASSDGKRGSTTLRVVAKRTITGTVTTVDGGARSALEFTARFGARTPDEQRYTTGVTEATGTFSLDVPALPAGAGAVQLHVDAPLGTTRRYHPSLAAMPAENVPSAALSVLLLPVAVVPDSGTYAGTRVPVSIHGAFTAPCATPGNINCQSFWPSYWAGGIKMWPDAARPIPLAIDRTGLSAFISAADSAAMWATVRQMEADLGRRLHEPATFSAYTTTGFQSGAVLVTIDAAIPGGSGFTNWNWDAQGNIFQARIRYATVSLMRSAGLMTHELLHGQGFSHSCQWATVMGGYGCGSADRVTASDAAYFQLAQLVRRRIAELRPTWGLAEARAGEMELSLGLVASASVSSAPRSRALEVPAAGSDSSGGRPHR